MSNQFQEAQYASTSNPNNEGPGTTDNRRLRLEVHSTTWTTLRRPTGSSSQLHEIPPVTNLGAPDCHLWRIWHLVTWDRSLSQLPTPLCSFQWFTHILFLLDTSWLRRPLCALPNDSHLSYLSPEHYLIEEPLTQLPTIDCSNIKMSRLSRWQVNNNNSRTTGRGGLPTTFMSCNIANAGIAHPTTSNLEIPCSWGRTTRLHSTGPQRSSLMSTQAQTATRVVTIKNPKGTVIHPISKICPLLHVKNEL